jgi:hypothetical protein
VWGSTTKVGLNSTTKLCVHVWVVQIMSPTQCFISVFSTTYLNAYFFFLSSFHQFIWHFDSILFISFSLSTDTLFVFFCLLCNKIFEFVLFYFNVNLFYSFSNIDEFYYRYNHKSIIFGHTHIKEKNLNINNNVTSTIINQFFYI